MKIGVLSLNLNPAMASPRKPQKNTEEEDWERRRVHLLGIGAMPASVSFSVRSVCSVGSIPGFRFTGENPALAALARGCCCSGTSCLCRNRYLDLERWSHPASAATAACRSEKNPGRADWTRFQLGLSDDFSGSARKSRPASRIARTNVATASSSARRA